MSAKHDKALSARVARGVTPLKDAAWQARMPAVQSGDISVQRTRLRNACKFFDHEYDPVAQGRNYGSRRNREDPCPDYPSRDSPFDCGEAFGRADSDDRAGDRVS